jgi:hypothetical protein
MEWALRRLEVFFRVQTEYPREYPRTGKKPLSLDLLLSESDTPAERSLLSEQPASI